MPEKVYVPWTIEIMPLEDGTCEVGLSNKPAEESWFGTETFANEEQATKAANFAQHAATMVLKRVLERMGGQVEVPVLRTLEVE